MMWLGRSRDLPFLSTVSFSERSLGAGQVENS